MSRVLKMSLKIDMVYAINSFIYVLSKLPIFRDLITEDIYKSKTLKKCVGILGIILSLGKMICYRLLYFLAIYLISKIICPDNIGKAFIHIYFIFTVIGMFINNKLLNVSTKKYFSIVLFGMDAKEYMKSSLGWDLFLSLLLNSFGFLIFSLVLKLPLMSCLVLILFSLFIRVVGEGFNLLFYKKFNYIWYNNTILYFIILGLLLAVSLLPYFSIFVSFNGILIAMIASFILFGLGIFYLNHVDDYQIIYKKLNTLKAAFNKDNQRAYSRQAMVAVRDKDRNISDKRLRGKKGYELFNTIFFERHKEILFRSAKNYAVILGIGYLLVLLLVIVNNSFDSSIRNFLLNRLGWFVIIMYFINRGAIITQAMFFNCDHAMLTYNFYREPKVLLGLFKKRLITVVKVNLVPAFIVALGNLILLVITGGSSILTYITSFLFIIFLSVFFSVHYMVIYYLLQPYNKNMEIKKVSYSIVSLCTYFVAYTMSDLAMSSLSFSLLGLIFTACYIIVGLFLVYKMAPRTFKIN